MDVEAAGGTAFRELVEPYRRELQVHCYRMLGSVQDAEDLVQETLLAAWRGIGEFGGRASLRTWLYRIATNRCLNALRDAGRRPAGYEGFEAALPEPSFRGSEPSWLEPYPDALLDEIVDREPGPEARYQSWESISLAFLAALQQLSPRQRAVLILRDVLGFRAAEAARMLDTTENAVETALRRARGGLDRNSVTRPDSAVEQRVAAAFARAFEAGDVDAVVALLADDVRLTMPPVPLEYHGVAAVRNFLAAVALQDGQRYVLIPTRANGQPAYGSYSCDSRTPIRHAHGVMVLGLSGDRIIAVTRFLDNALLSRFGLPHSLRA
jgi:RNA polymerase sigma-70 factor (TIGR02960 family)